MSRFDLRASTICAALVLAAPLVSFSHDSRKPMAIVAGQPIYEEDLMSVAGRV